MKIIVKAVSGILLLGLLGITSAEAQNRQQAQKYSRNFDVSTVETLQGEIAEIISERGKVRAIIGKHLVLNANNSSTIEVHLGPVWYLEEQESNLKQGDQITVTGSRITFQDKEVIIASVIQKGSMELRLRDEQGMPFWKAWRSKRVGSQ